MSDILERMAAIMRDLKPQPRRELRCGKTAWDVMRWGMKTDPLGNAEPLLGIPVHIDPDMRDAAWEITEDGQVVSSGDMAPDTARAFFIAGVGIIGASDEAAAMVEENIQRARGGDA